MMLNACIIFFFRDMASIVFDREDADDQVLAQALYVNEVDLGDEDTDQEQPPASGEEYLRQVVRQANKLQFATTAENADQLLNQVTINFIFENQKTLK